VLPNIYDEAYYSGGTPPKWDFTKVEASAVVINLGTNDTASGAGGAVVPRLQGCHGEPYPHRAR